MIKIEGFRFKLVLNGSKTHMLIGLHKAKLNTNLLCLDKKIPALNLIYGDKHTKKMSILDVFFTNHLLNRVAKSILHQRLM